MKLLKYLFFFTFLLISTAKAFSQCFQIESILVDACDNGTDEGLNEMVRFKVGNAAINSSTLSVNWPNNTWQSLVQNATTASKVATLNAQILAAGGCGQLIQPTGGVLPANVKVILVTSYNFSVALNYFGAITENIYIIFQNNSATTAGHFGNYNATPGTRTLTMNFGSCSDTVTYERSLLINTNGTYGGSSALNDGSTVNYTPSGTPTYINNGCVAPVETFTVSAGTSPIAACPGTTIALAGTAQGQQSVQWSAPSGSFSAPVALSTNYTVGNVTGPITLTLTATNTCGNTKTSTVTVNVGSGTTPTFNAISPICSGSTLAALPTVSLNGVSGSWSPALNNTATTTYTFTPNVGQCAPATTLTVVVNALVTPTFTQVGPLCTGSSFTPLPTISLNGISGTWSPALNNTATTTYTFTPNPASCATTATMTVVVGSNIVPTFNAIQPICTGGTLQALPLTSLNGISGTWAPAINNTITTTYTFTPNTGQCAVNASLTIVVNSNVLPTFNVIAAICSGGSLSPLPTTSLNGISGTWAPALNNTATTTYTFTPNVGQCAAPGMTVITVNSASTVPTFNPIPGICAGSNLAPLPTTSLNNISGTWSPALSNTATTSYTFTPDAGQCASNTTLQIEVQQDFDFKISGNCVNASFVYRATDDSNSFDLATASYNWQNSDNVTVGNNSREFNVSEYLNATPQTEQFPLNFTLIITSAEGCIKTKTVTLENIYCDIQRGISPNNDHKNDFFDLALLEVRELEIFNRYGTKVYSKAAYTNEWHGQSDKGDTLPDGTYYYVIKFNNKQESKTGWVYINK